MTVAVSRMKAIGKGLHISPGDKNIGAIRKKSALCDKSGIPMTFFIWCVRKGVEIDNTTCFAV